MSALCIRAGKENMAPQSQSFQGGPQLATAAVSNQLTSCVGGKGGIPLYSSNAPSGSSNGKACFLYDPTDGQHHDLIESEPLGIQDPREFGGQVKLVSEPQILSSTRLRPVMRGISQRT